MYVMEKFRNALEFGRKLLIFSENVLNGIEFGESQKR